MQGNSINNGDRRIEEPRNRAYDTRRDTDTFTTPSINIYDIDYAILYHLNSNIDVSIEENGKMIKVPVMFANGETWTQIQKHGYLRDKSRKIMTPVIALKRNSMELDDRVPKLKTTQRNSANQIIYFPDTQTNNQNDWIHKTQNTKKSKTYFLSVMPDFVRVSYELFIWTDLVIQMNSIIEQILPENRLVWGGAMKFETEVSDYSFDILNDTGTDRIVQCTMPLLVRGGLQPEYESKQSTIQKAHSIKRVVFTDEQSNEEFYVDEKPKIIRPAESRLPTKRFNTGETQI